MQSVARVLNGTVRMEGVPDQFENRAASIVQSAIDSGSLDRLRAWWLYRCLYSPDPLRERLESVEPLLDIGWDYFSPRTGSPAAGTGPNGRDKGAVASSPSPLDGVRGVAINGEPIGTTPLNTATLRIDPLRTGTGIPTAGFADGSGFTHYKWSLDGGAWSAETPAANPITLSALSAGPHFVEVVGKNDAGFYQDNPIFGEDAVITVSRTWTVDPTSSTLRLNEILASNGGAVNHNGTTPDVVELHNASDAVLNVAGMRLTDDINNPDKFIFPAGATVPARGYLVVYANNADGTPGHHLGFSLGQEGESVYLFAAAAGGGRLLDSITFGPQLTDLSIGRLADGEWALTQPTFGAANRAAQLGDPRALRLNEWLAIGEAPFNSDSHNSSQTRCVSSVEALSEIMSSKLE